MNLLLIGMAKEAMEESGSQVKEADVPSEVIGGALSQQVPIVGPLAALGGAAAAGATPTKSDEEMREQSKAFMSNIIPGAGHYRTMKRLGRSGKDTSYGSVASEIAGPFTTMAGAALLGEAINQGIRNYVDEDTSKPYTGTGALLGAGAGTLANIVGALSAAATPTRSDEEMEPSSERVIANLLVPGAGAHNYWKRMGHSWDKYRADLSREEIDELREKLSEAQE